MTYFGDIAIPWIVSKDTSISKEIVEKNFVDEPPQVYELTPDLEAGTYSAILNETVQEKNESFEEQQDAVLSMVSRHGTEFPFSVGGDTGYIIVETASVNTSPDLEIREAEVGIRFMDDNDYYSAVRANPIPHRNGFYDTQASPVESLVAFPSDIDPIGFTADYQVTTDEGVIDLYIVDSTTVFSFEEDPNDITLSQSQSVCRLFSVSDERIYTGDVAVGNGAYIDNGLVRVDYQSDRSHVDYYNGSSWEPVGSAMVPMGDGYASENTNDKIETTFVNGYQNTVHRGFSASAYTFDNEDHFYFIFDDNSFTEVAMTDYYGHWQDVNGNDVIVVNPNEDGSMHSYTSAAAIESLIPGTEYTMFVAIVPDSIPVDDYARYLYNLGTRSRTFVQQ